MSKSNLKNINNLSKEKYSYLIYNYKTYSNILLKLKKSVLWSSNPNALIATNIFNYVSSANIILTVDINWIWTTYVLYKNNYIRYNPLLVTGKNTVFESSSMKNYNYIDVDILEYLKKLERINYKKIQEMKLQNTLM